VSDVVLRIIATDPAWVPTEEQSARVLAVLRSFAPMADDVTAEVLEHIAFIDSGADLATIRCPFCTADLDEIWHQWMDVDSSTAFATRAHTTPCCEREVQLEGLAYEAPCGFARFLLEARNAGIGRSLNIAETARIEEALGHAIREIHARL